MQPAAAIDAESGRGIALRIEIDDQNFLADRSKRRAEIDGGSGLADAALLIGDGEHARRPYRTGQQLLLGRRCRHRVRCLLHEWRVAHRSRPNLIASPNSFACWARLSAQLHAPPQRGFGIGSTRHRSRLKPPIFSGFGQFSIYPLSLREKADGAPFQQADRPPPAVWKAGQRRGRSRRRHLPARPSTKSAIRMAWTATGAPVACAASRRKRRLLGTALDKCNARARRLGQGAGNRHSRKARARAEIGPDASLRRKRQKLKRVSDMAGPERGFRRRRNQIDPALPLEQKRHKAIQTIQCFT